jgi:hypothetical protein
MRGKRIFLAAIVVALVFAATSVAIGATSHPNIGLAGRQKAGPATIITGSCKAPKVNFASNDANTSTTSTVFANLPGASVGFTIPGAATSCIVAEYSGQAFAPDTSLIQIQVLLDGATAGAPGVVQLVGDDEGSFSDSYAMQFVWANVAPGAHSVTVQWRSFNGVSVAINKGTLVVQHK